VRHLGIDVHLKSTEICELSEKGKILDRSRIPTTELGYRRYFGRRKRRRIVMESGPSTPWVYRLLRELGHEVIVLEALVRALGAAGGQGQGSGGHGPEDGGAAPSDVGNRDALRGVSAEGLRGRSKLTATPTNGLQLKTACSSWGRPTPRRKAQHAPIERTITKSADRSSSLVWSQTQHYPPGVRLST